MRVLLVHSDNRRFEVERFGAAWAASGGRDDELVPITPGMAVADRDAAIAGTDGVLLTGGPDVEPARYEAAPTPGVELHCSPDRDDLDLALLDRAAAADWPVLAVCYGIQVLNVFYGGSLIQDLDRAGRPGHHVREPKDLIAHTVRRRGGRFLKWLPDEFGVNSRHHQAIDRLAAPLQAVAWAPDGVIEAVELREGPRFVVGVQWHPENILEEPHLSVFRAFRAACAHRH